MINLASSLYALRALQIMQHKWKIYTKKNIVKGVKEYELFRWYSALFP